MFHFVFVATAFVTFNTNCAGLEPLFPLVSYVLSVYYRNCHEEHKT